MLRALVIIGIIIVGVGIAFGIVALGCVGEHPALGTMCGHNLFGSIIVLSFAAWFVLGTLVVGIRAIRNNE